MVTLVKFGGSLITDKRIQKRFRQNVMNRLAREIYDAFVQLPDTSLILGHGSGSFGHFEAKKHGTIKGVYTPEQWQGFTKVATVAAELNSLVANCMTEVSLPVMRFQPSASVLAENGNIIEMNIELIQQALRHKIIPLVHGDVAFDEQIGGTIVSTEKIFTYLVHHIPVKQIFLLGEVDGVYDQNGAIIPHITTSNIGAIHNAIGLSGGVDVTGGMLIKVEDMLQLTSTYRGLEVRIFNGMTPGLLTEALLGQVQPGTLITKS